LNVLSNVNRFRIFRSLWQHNQLTSQEIIQILQISPSLATQHLDKLESKGILLRNNSQSEIYYSLNKSSRQVIAIRLFLF